MNEIARSGTCDAVSQPTHTPNTPAGLCDLLNADLDVTMGHGFNDKPGFIQGCFGFHLIGYSELLQHSGKVLSAGAFEGVDVGDALGIQQGRAQGIGGRNVGHRGLRRIGTPDQKVSGSASPKAGAIRKRGARFNAFITGLSKNLFE